MSNTINPTAPAIRAARPTAVGPIDRGVVVTLPGDSLTLRFAPIKLDKGTFPAAAELQAKLAAHGFGWVMNLPLPLLPIAEMYLRAGKFLLGLVK